VSTDQTPKRVKQHVCLALSDFKMRELQTSSSASRISWRITLHRINCG